MGKLALLKANVEDGEDKMRQQRAYILMAVSCHGQKRLTVSPGCYGKAGAAEGQG